MIDAISILQAQRSKTVARVARLEKSLETERLSLSDIDTTLRVLGALSDESLPRTRSGLSTSVAERQEAILSLVPVGIENGASPSDLYAAYDLIHEKISIDVFRTTLWRMGKEGIVHSGGGRYWRIETHSSDITEDDFEGEFDSDPPY